MSDSHRSAPQGFSRSAESYDAAVRHNIAGSERLVRSLPDGDHRRLLDVGCGTGFTSLAMMRRFEVRQLVGVDPAEGMLEVFAGKLAAFPSIDVRLLPQDVMAIDVEDHSVDAVVSAMALHWFPDKTGAVARMARTLRPGGVMGLLTAGRGGETEWQRVLVEAGASPEWTGWFEQNQRDVDEIAADLVAAGMEPIDVWMERRRRRTPVDEFMARTRSVAAHLLDNPPGGRSDVDRRIEAALRAAADGSGRFAYDYCKLFAVARRPDRGRAAPGSR